MTEKMLLGNVDNAGTAILDSTQTNQKWCFIRTHADVFIVYSRTSTARNLMAHSSELARAFIMDPIGHSMHYQTWLAELFFMVPSLFEPLKFYCIYMR